MRPHRLGVRTPPFHGGGRGSNPLGDALLRENMKRENYDTIFEDVLAATLKMMYMMREDKKFNINTPSKNYYRSVMEELDKKGSVEAPVKDDINRLYEEIETAEKKEEEL